MILQSDKKIRQY